MEREREREERPLRSFVHLLARARSLLLACCRRRPRRKRIEVVCLSPSPFRPSSSPQNERLTEEGRPRPRPNLTRDEDADDATLGCGLCFSLGVKCRKSMLVAKVWSFCCLRVVSVCSQGGH